MTCMCDAGGGEGRAEGVKGCGTSARVGFNFFC